MKEIIIGIILIIVGVYSIYFVEKYPFSKDYDNANFGCWLWGIIFIMGGIYTIIRALIELFH
ncbi:MAG: hypothetical protein OHK0036_17250 [Bacteroidia bacterium]